MEPIDSHRLRSSIAAACVLLSGCASFPVERTTSCIARTAFPAIEKDPIAGTASTEISVLSYNVEGLPWPARKNRTPQLREIGRQLGEMRRKGTAPDVVLLQEAFTRTAARIGESAGYPNLVRGPGRRRARPPTSAEADPALIDRRKRNKGEGFGRFLSSGLYILSDFPISEAAAQPFRSRECAGFDCLANKGLQHARIWVPGVPVPLDLFNTHLNSRGASRVSEARSLKAHRLQIDETSRFIEEWRDRRSPMIFGGDFNMRQAEDRFQHFALKTPYTLVHQYCVQQPAVCDVRMSWDGDAPWMDTQDLQGFEDGEQVSIRPVKVEAMFDWPWRGRPLADHDGLLVVYRLSWPIAAEAAAVGPPLCA